MYAWCIDKLGGRGAFSPSGPCEGWFRAFRQKYPEAVKLRRPDRVDRGRAVFFTVNILRDYFQLLRLQLEEGNFLSRN